MLVLGHGCRPAAVPAFPAILRAAARHYEGLRWFDVNSDPSPEGPNLLAALWSRVVTTTPCPRHPAAIRPPTARCDHLLLPKPQQEAAKGALPGTEGWTGEQLCPSMQA